MSIKALLIFIFQNFAGSFNHDISWTINDFGDDVIFAKIQYKSEKCEKPQLIQIAKVLNNQNKNHKWEMGESNRNLTAYDGYFVDVAHFSVKETKSTFYTDYFKEGSKSEKFKISMEDAPFGWSEISSIDIEVCSFCPSTNKFEQCFMWGGNFDLNGNKTLKKQTITPEPSKIFLNTLNNFIKFYNLEDNYSKNR